jgi:undecaprenyl-diphosphatase
MSIWQAIILGIVQGLTEFIPISSTAHLTLAGKIMGSINPDQPEQWTAFIAVLQLGTLVAVILYFLPDLAMIIRGFISYNLDLITRRRTDRGEKHWTWLGWLIIVGTIPVGVLGLLFRHVIEGKLTKNLWVITCTMLGLAIVLTIAEIVGSRRREMEQLRMSDAIIIGIAQCFALIPGSSRSGTTITGGLFAGLTREAAARYSFLLSIPAVGASGLLELPKAMHTMHGGWGQLVLATVVSGVFGYASIAFLLRYLQRHTTYLFVGYRLALGLLLLVLLVSGKVSAY